MQKIALKSIKNQKYNKTFNSICSHFNAENFFNFVHSTFINYEEKEIHSLKLDPNNYVKFYIEEKFITIDPTINFIFNSNRELILFEEMNYIETVNKKGEIFYPGKIINDHKTSSRFNLKNGFYTILRFNSKYALVNSYAYDSKNFAVDKFLDTRSVDGKWFNDFTRNLNHIAFNIIKEKYS